MPITSHALVLSHASSYHSHSLDSNSNTPVELIPAGDSSTYHDIANLILTNEASSATVVILTDGDVTYKIALAANGGAVISFPVVPLLQTSKAKAWNVSNSAGVMVHYIVNYVDNG